MITLDKENTIIVELGNGGILVGNIKQYDENKKLLAAGISFKMSEKMPIGTTVDVREQPQYKGSDIILAFKNIESLEIFEGVLKKAKKSLKNK